MATDKQVTTHAHFIFILPYYRTTSTPTTQSDNETFDARLLPCTTWTIAPAS
jgi:hypothetical protein